jgi:hypothetical protein
MSRFLRPTTTKNGILSEVGVKAPVFPILIVPVSVLRRTVFLDDFFSVRAKEPTE